MLCFNNNIINGVDLAPVKLHLSPPPPPTGGLGAVRSKAEVLLLLVHCLLLLPLFVGVLCLVLDLLSFLVLQSSCRGRESWLLYFNCLHDVL